MGPKNHARALEPFNGRKQMASTFACFPPPPPPPQFQNWDREGVWCTLSNNNIPIPNFTMRTDREVINSDGALHFCIFPGLN